MNIKYLLAIIMLMMIGCNTQQKTEVENSFKSDLNFLDSHKKTIVLSNEDSTQMIAVIPDYQGRVMTSTANGFDGNSYGWINYNLIKSGEFQAHINVFGGEDRFWLGPEGGQYSIFFEPETDFTLDNWQTPAPIDTEAFELVSQEANKVSFKKQMHLKNYSNFEFDVAVKRDIELLDKSALEADLGIKLSEDTKYVGFHTLNEITNAGDTQWTKETGLLSIWNLGMFISADANTVIMPYVNELDLNTAYFGPIDSTRLKTDNKAVYFKADGKYRCKIGLPPHNVKDVFGSFDPDKNILTIVKYTFKDDSTYVNSLWKKQDEPYKGDVINSYNDGPLDNGDILGPFYELETSSSSIELMPGEKMSHRHATYHFEGSFEALNKIALDVLGVSLKDIPFTK